MKYFYFLLAITSFISCKKESLEAVSSEQIEKISVQEDLKNLYPEIGYTPDISFSAKQNFINNQKLYNEISKLIDSIGDFEEAKKHLTESQIEIYQNEGEFMAEDHLSVGGVGCSWYCGGGPMSIKATSELNPNKGFTYTADNIHDFSLRNAWIEGKKSSGINETITFEFNENGPPVTTVEIFNGYMKTEKTWEENGRVKKLKLYVNDKPIAILNVNGFYDALIALLQTMTEKGLLKEVNQKMLLVSDTIDDLLYQMKNYVAPSVGKWIDKKEL